MRSGSLSFSLLHLGSAFADRVAELQPALSQVLGSNVTELRFPPFEGRAKKN